MNIYSLSVKKLRNIIRENFGEVESSKGLDNLPAHLLWMLDQIESMKDLLKASRWIGYILGRMEAQGLLTNKQSRDLIRQDVSRQNH